MSQQISASLTAILDLERLESNLFRGRSPKSTWPRVFGGQVIAQSLYAACKTVEGRQPHSLHAYFLLPGDPEQPIVYEVDRLRDGRSFTTRRVLAIQKGEAIFAMSASFQVDEPGYEHQMPMPKVPMPEELPDREEMASSILPHMPDAVQAYYQRKRPIEIRPVELERYRTGGKMEPKFNVWIRAMEPLPDEPALHRLDRRTRFAERVCRDEIDEAAKREARWRADVARTLRHVDTRNIARFDKALRRRTAVEARIAGRDAVKRQADLLLVESAQIEFERKAAAACVAR